MEGGVGYERGFDYIQTIMVNTYKEEYIKANMENILKSPQNLSSERKIIDNLFFFNMIFFFGTKLTHAELAQ
jgi:hypothetical protein